MDMMGKDAIAVMVDVSQNAGFIPKLAG
jgi:hypothetical protein